MKTWSCIFVYYRINFSRSVDYKGTWNWYILNTCRQIFSKLQTVFYKVNLEHEGPNYEHRGTKLYAYWNVPMFCLLESEMQSLYV